MDNTPNLALPLLANKQALQTTFHDEALKTLDALVMLSVIDRDLSSPPPTPSEGDRYLVNAPGSGDPAWLDDRIVVFLDGNWMALAPRLGWTCYVEDEGVLIAWDGTAWQPALDVLGGGAANNLALLGVGTTADAVNPFSAKLNNALWVARTVAEGGDGDLRYKMSKESAANTLSVLFQDNFSGRAEIGLTGDDDFHFKVSPDGSAWIDALAIDHATGGVRFLAHETSVASAVTCDIGAAASLKVAVTGTAAIASFGTQPNRLKFVRFADALTLTHHASSLILLTGANRTTAAGDIGIYASDDSGNWRELYFSRTPATVSLPGILRRPTMAILRDEKSSGTNAGTFTQATDVTRTLNTKTDPDSIVVLASNQFQLGPGTWLIQWSAPGYRCESHKSWLYNVTDAAVASYGTNENSGALDVVLTKSTGAAIVTIAVAKAFEIRHRCTTTKADNGLGLAVSLGAEVYTEVVVRSYQQA